MAYELNASNLLNPMMVWSDLGMRALDMTLSSSQNITESVDRLTRASVEPVEDVVSNTVSRQTELDVPSAVALSTDLQRSTFDIMVRSWLQWMSTIGTFASIAAGLGENRNPKRQDPLAAIRNSLLPFTGAATAAARSGSSSRQQSGRREARAESGSTEHAFASGEPKRRRTAGRSKSKSRRSRSS